MVTAHNTALQEGPEAVNGLCVDRTINVLTTGMPDSAVIFQLAIAGMIVGSDQTDFFRHGFADETVQRFRISILDDASHDIALALDGANDSFFPFATSSFGALIPMPVLVLAADVRFIDFDNAHELAELWIGEASADAMAHVVSRRIGTETKHAVHLQSGDAFLAGQNEIYNFEPSFHWHVGVLKDCSNENGKAIASCGTSTALPMKRTSANFSKFFIPATRAADAIRPASCNEIGLASFIGWEQPLELRDCHLLGELWTGHRSAPDV